MTMLQVVKRTKVYLDEVDTSKGYVMKGNKGDFILARTTDDKYSFVRLTPGKTTKPVNAYASAQKAIEAKIEAGYEVFQYTKAELS